VCDSDLPSLLIRKEDRQTIGSHHNTRLSRLITPAGIGFRHTAVGTSFHHLNTVHLLQPLWSVLQTQFTYQLTSIGRNSSRIIVDMITQIQARIRHDTDTT
jgi:hypothetical protein